MCLAEQISVLSSVELGISSQKHMIKNIPLMKALHKVIGNQILHTNMAKMFENEYNLQNNVSH